MQTNEVTWAQLGPRYEALGEQDLTTGNVGDWLSKWSELEKDVEEQLVTLQRAKDENTRDKAAETAYLTFVQDVRPPLEVANQHLKLKLLNLKGYEPSSETAEFIKRFRNEAELFRDANAPLLAEETALSSEYNTLLGGLTVELDGSALTLPEAEKRLLEPDRALRERAWRAIGKAKLSISDELDALFLELLELRRQLARNAGLPNYRDFRWREFNRFDYTPEDSQTFHDAIATEAVPLLVALREARQEEMNLSALRPWDLSVDPQGRAPLTPFKTVDELEEGLARIFSRLDPELAAQFGTLREGWLELETREGKVPGLGYQSFFPKSKKPYIYWSANGTHRDVLVLVHEAGHAFHSLASVARNDLVWNFYPGMEFAEVASQAMELLTLPYLSKEAGGFYSDEDTARAKREGLERVLHQLPGQAQSDAFQHWLYTEAPADVTPGDLDAKWLELSETFSPGVDWSGLERERAKGWHYFHIFAVPFYMLEYAYAWLGAVQIWQNALRDPRTALSDYRAALALGGTRPLPELFETAGAHFAFDRQTVGELMRFVYEQRS
jgi:oligoendopeptidase F